MTEVNGSYIAKMTVSRVRMQQHSAITQTSNELEVAEINYAMVKHALNQASEKFKQRESVKTPKPIPTLLKEAANAGHAEAREFINSTQGKAVLK
ncbi:hypothetical protein ACPV5Q_15750 [Vibrio astriarenae]